MSPRMLPLSVNFDPPASIWKSGTGCRIGVSGTSFVSCHAMSYWVEFACFLGMGKALDTYLEWPTALKCTLLSIRHPIYASAHTLRQTIVVCPFDMSLLHLLLHGIAPRFPITC